MTSLRERAPVHYRRETERERQRENAYVWLLSVDDGDYEHTHDGGHAFPCTKEQLVSLRRQINEVLGRSTEPAA